MDALRSWYDDDGSGPPGSLTGRSAYRLLILRLCLLVVFITAIWFWPLGPQYVAVPPSFDCGQAQRAAEKTICADALLAKTDADFAVYYQDNLEVAVTFQAADIEAALKRSERDFIAARNRCGRSKWCIERQYLDQDLRIADLSGEPHRTTVPLRSYRNHYIGVHVKAWAGKLLRNLAARHRRGQAFAGWRSDPARRGPRGSGACGG